MLQVSEAMLRPTPGGEKRGRIKTGIYQNVASFGQNIATMSLMMAERSAIRIRRRFAQRFGLDFGFAGFLR